MPDNPTFGGTGPGLDLGDVIDFGRGVIDFFGGGGQEGILAQQLHEFPDVATPGQNGAAVAGCPPVVVPVEMIARAKVPRGYVVVIDPKTKQKIGMIKVLAQKCKLWKPARKPPISASDWRCLQRANMTVKKLDRVVKMSNKITGKASLTRTRKSR